MVSNSMAIPALRQKVMVKQPDGTTVTIMLHGDEWQHFTTTDDGYTVKKNKQGYYVYAQKVDDELRATDIVAHDQVNRTANEVAFLQGVKKYQTPKMSAYNAQMKDSITKHQQQTLLQVEPGHLLQNVPHLFRLQRLPFGNLTRHNQPL